MPPRQDGPIKLVVGLGNPGPEYDGTRHNVGWWVLDRLAYDWGCPVFRREGAALVTEAAVVGATVRLMKPLTYMNRSGAALKGIEDLEGFDLERDLLVAVDDAAIDVGQVRLRAQGGTGGHNGLRSVSGALGSNEFARLRVGVGRRPEGTDLADWVLSPMPSDDEEVVLGLLPKLTGVVETWVCEGVEAAVARLSR